MSIALVSSDFDGTLEDKKFPDGSAGNIKAFTALDLNRVINSGSNPQKLIHAVNQVSERSWRELSGPFIASGGALLLEPGVAGPIWEVPLEGIEDILKDIKLSEAPLNDYIYLLSKDGWIKSQNLKINDSYYVVSIRVGTEDEALLFRDRFSSDSLSITLNHDAHGGGIRIQIASKDAGKDKVIGFLAGRFGFKSCELAHLGDDWNDLPAWLMPDVLSGIVETTNPKLKSLVPEPLLEIVSPKEAGVAKFLKGLKSDY